MAWKAGIVVVAADGNGGKGTTKSDPASTRRRTTTTSSPSARTTTTARPDIPPTTSCRRTQAEPRARTGATPTWLRPASTFRAARRRGIDGRRDHAGLRRRDDAAAPGGSLNPTWTSPVFGNRQPVRQGQRNVASRRDGLGLSRPHALQVPGLTNDQVKYMLTRNTGPIQGGTELRGNGGLALGFVSSAIVPSVTTAAQSHQAVDSGGTIDNALGNDSSRPERQAAASCSSRDRRSRTA